MFHLALETSTREGSFCLLDGDRPLESVRLDRRDSTTGRLIPAMADAANRHGLSWMELKLISVSTGPGSFTGLRVGVTVARTLAYATGCRVVGVPTHAVICRQAFLEISARNGDTSVRVASMIGAQRNEWFLEVREVSSGGQSVLAPSRVVGRDELRNAVQAGCVWCGPGLRLIPELEDSQALRQVCGEAFRDPRAAETGAVGWAASRQNQWTDPYRLVPDYGRPSAAEERLDNS